MSAELEKLKREIASIQSSHAGSGRRLIYSEKIKAAAIRLFREQSQLSPYAFAEQLGISTTAINGWLGTKLPRRDASSMIPIKVQTPSIEQVARKSGLSPTPRVTIIVIEGDESGAQSDQIFRALKIINQAS